MIRSTSLSFIALLVMALVACTMPGKSGDDDAPPPATTRTIGGLTFDNATSRGTYGPALPKASSLTGYGAYAGWTGTIRFTAAEWGGIAGVKEEDVLTRGASGLTEDCIYAFATDGRLYLLYRFNSNNASRNFTASDANPPWLELPASDISSLTVAQTWTTGSGKVAQVMSKSATSPHLRLTGCTVIRFRDTDGSLYDTYRQDIFLLAEEIHSATDYLIQTPITPAPLWPIAN